MKPDIPAPTLPAPPIPSSLPSSPPLPPSRCQCAPPRTGDAQTIETFLALSLSLSLFSSSSLQWGFGVGVAGGARCQPHQTPPPTQKPAELPSGLHAARSAMSPTRTLIQSRPRSLLFSLRPPPPVNFFALCNIFLHSGVSAKGLLRSFTLAVQAPATCTASVSTSIHLPAAEPPLPLTPSVFSLFLPQQRMALTFDPLGTPRSEQLTKKYFLGGVGGDCPKIY